MSHPKKKPRLVDTLPSVRTMPMKVIVLGLNRTGTMSMFTALQQLGFHPCHGTNMWADPKKNLTLWTEAMRAKYFGEGEPWGRRELDVVLGGFDAVLDLPSALLIPELLTAYPTAKFILTTRPVDHWLRSMNATIFPTMTWPSWYLLSHLDPDFVKPWWVYKQTVKKGWAKGDFGNENMKKIFEDHEVLVKRMVPGDRLLVFEVEEGWGPLCGFLKVERPGGKFPHVNDKEEYVRGFRRARNRAVWRVVRKGLVVVVVLVAVMCALYWMV